MSVTKCPDCGSIISLQFPMHKCRYGEVPEVHGFRIVKMSSYEAASELMRLRDRLSPILELMYEGSNDVLKPIPGSTSKYSTKQRKMTLREARMRVKHIMPRLNAVINYLAESPVG